MVAHYAIEISATRKRTEKSNRKQKSMRWMSTGMWTRFSALSFHFPEELLVQLMEALSNRFLYRHKKKQFTILEMRCMMDE
jgi:hypothetical protein